jgi:hypothetical protein
MPSAFLYYTNRTAAADGRFDDRSVGIRMTCDLASSDAKPARYNFFLIIPTEQPPPTADSPTDLPESV